MEIQINIAIDNAAFEDTEGSEVTRILRKLADDYDKLGCYPFMNLRDINGNVVGAAVLLEG